MKKNVRDGFLAGAIAYSTIVIMSQSVYMPIATFLASAAVWTAVRFNNSTSAFVAFAVPFLMLITASWFFAMSFGILGYVVTIEITLAVALVFVAWLFGG